MAISSVFTHQKGDFPWLCNSLPEGKLTPKSSILERCSLINHPWLPVDHRLPPWYLSEVCLRGAGGLRLAEAGHARSAARGGGAAQRPTRRRGAADPRLSTGARRGWDGDGESIGDIEDIRLRCTV